MIYLNFYRAPMAELVDATDSKSVELRFMSVRVGLGVPLTEKKNLLRMSFMSPMNATFHLVFF